MGELDVLKLRPALIEVMAERSETTAYAVLQGCACMAVGPLVTRREQRTGQGTRTRQGQGVSFLAQHVPASLGPMGKLSELLGWLFRNIASRSADSSHHQRHAAQALAEALLFALASEASAAGGKYHRWPAA